MLRAVLSLGIFVFLALLAWATPAAADTPTPDEVIAVGDSWFCDSSYANGVCPTDISLGDTVQWDFSGSFLQHTATDCGASCTTPTGSPLFNSGFVPPSPQQYKFTFNTPGQYVYYCQFHPTQMQGVINVGGVGGVTELGQPETSPLQAGDSSGGSSALIAALAVAVAAGVVVALGGFAWYARRAG